MLRVAAGWANDQSKSSREGDCPRYKKCYVKSISSLSEQGYSPHINRNRRFIERGIDGVDRNRVEGICCITADIDNNTQPTGFACFGNRFIRDKWRDLRGEIDAVHKDIDIEDLVKRTTLGCFSHIPLEDVVSGKIETFHQPSQ